MMISLLLRLAPLAVTNTFSLICLLPMSEREKEIELLVLRHQLTILQHHAAKPVFTPDDRFLVAGLLHHLPLDKVRRLQLLERPDTILRRHRNFLKRRHAVACAPRQRGRGPGPSRPRGDGPVVFSARLLSLEAIRHK
ncbi:hypothetical protein [Streptomyces sp. NPDC047009]|uniref:hypothetical protein n=1 Tax=Streptomyces sp. NPDC047009 TaxID=3154496 RepID=UPI0033CFA623